VAPALLPLRVDVQLAGDGAHQAVGSIWQGDGALQADGEKVDWRKSASYRAPVAGARVGCRAETARPNG
jgi:hypothetical protein